MRKYLGIICFFFICTGDTLAEFVPCEADAEMGLGLPRPGCVLKCECEYNRTAGERYWRCGEECNYPPPQDDKPRYRANPNEHGAVFSGLGPCTCKDLDKIKENLDRAATSEEIWKYIFAWARELYRDVDLPQTNDDLNQKFVQLMNAPSSRWYDLIKEGPVKEKKSLKKVAGLSEKGEPVVDEDFQNSNCDDIIEAEKEHERKHKEFYLSFPQVFDVVMTSRLQRLRAESEVESYRAQKTFLEKKYADLKLKCLPKEDPSIKQ